MSSKTKKRRSRGGGRGGGDDSEDELDSELLGMGEAEDGGDLLEVRKEDARKQRQNAEQRRRDQLRDGYDRLQTALPAAGRDKMSKVRLIEFGERVCNWVQNKFGLLIVSQPHPTSER